MSHPKIADCAVIGLPDEKWGEKVVAVVKLKPGERCPEEELINFCKNAMAGYRVPESVFYVERPVALVALKGGAKLTEEELKDYLMVNYVNTGIIPKYWVPDKILFFADELPKTSTGKINKVLLRDKYKDAAV